MVNSMVTCSFMHASILKTGKRYVSEVDEASFIFRCRDFAKDYECSFLHIVLFLHYICVCSLGKKPPVPSRSFESHWDQRCEREWRSAFYCFAIGQCSINLLSNLTCNFIGIPTFMLNLALAGLIKFHEIQELKISISIIVFIAFLIYLRSCLLWAPHLLTKGSDIFRVRPLDLIP